MKMDASRRRAGPWDLPTGHDGAARTPGDGDEAASRPASAADHLENGSRAEVLRVIEERPGLSIQEVAEAMGLSRGAVRHHLGYLTRDGHVASHRHGNHVLLFSAAVPVMRRRAIFQLRIGSIRSIVEAAIERPRFRPVEVADEVGITVRSVRRGLRVLERAGLVQSESVRRGTYRLSFHPELRIAWVLYGKDAPGEISSLRKAPGWLIGLELLLGKLVLGGWASS